MKTINKRLCRKFAFPETRFQKNSGLLHHANIKYVVRAAVKNIDGHRTLILYLYAASEAADGRIVPLFTVFQTKKDFITLERLKDGKTKWRTAATRNLEPEYGFIQTCAFYSAVDEQAVLRYCQSNAEYGFEALSALQMRIQNERYRIRRRAKEQKIYDRMKPIPALPRGLKEWMHREILSQYLFFDNSRKKVDMPGYCTACRKEVAVSGAYHNKQGVCPNCKRTVTFKSRAMRGRIFDRGTVQVIQRLSDNELIIRFIKYVNRFFDKEQPDYDVYENARLFLSWKEGKKILEEHYYYRYGGYDVTPWNKGDRPVFSHYQYYFEADQIGYLYDRNLDEVLKGTPWQYSQLPLYYRSDPTPLEVLPYLSAYLRYPLVEYLVKLGLYRLTTYVVYERRMYGFGKQPINLNGRNLQEVLGMGKAYLPFLREVNPGLRQLSLIKAMLNEGQRPDKELLKWCAKFDVGQSQRILMPLRYMTAHKLMRYAEDEFARFRCTSYLQRDHHYDNMESLLSDYCDYLLMCEGLNYDLKSDFVLFPRDLPQAHDAVNELSDEAVSAIYNKRIAADFERLEQRYHFQSGGLLVTAPHSADELVAEGHKLRHCVGGYIKKVACNDCTILFIREAKRPDKPFCTVELQNGDVYQARVYKNHQPPAKVQRFIDRWKNEVLYTAADIQEAA